MQINIAQEYAAGTSQAAIAGILGVSEPELSKKIKSHLAAEINELNKRLAELQPLQANNEKLQRDLRTLQAIETEQRRSCNELQIRCEQLQQATTHMQVTETELQETATRLQLIETDRNRIETELQRVQTEYDRVAKQLRTTEQERNKCAHMVVELEKKLQPKQIKLQRLLTSPLFLLLAIIAFEGYNGWQLFANMETQQFPTAMAFVFSVFFGLASVTALAAGHRFGIILCITAAFFSNAIHAGLLKTGITFEGAFYTLLPCILIGLFADMYKGTTK